MGRMTLEAGKVVAATSPTYLEGPEPGDSVKGRSASEGLVVNAEFGDVGTVLAGHQNKPHFR